MLKLYMAKHSVINFATVSSGKPLMVRIEVKNALYAALSTSVQYRMSH